MSANEKSAEFTARVFRYLDDELSPLEAEAFEREVQADEGLDREFRAIAELDLLETLSRSVEPGQERAPDERPEGGGRGRNAKLFLVLSWGLGLAAAVVLIAVRVLGTGAPAQGPSVALLRVEASQDDYNARLGLDPGWLPAGNGKLSGGEQRRALPSVEEYAARVKELEDVRLAQALAHATGDPLVAERFTVGLRAEHELFAAVLTLPLSGALRLESLGDEDAVVLRLTGGVKHVLPRPTVRAPEPDRKQEGAPRVDYDPGFVVPLGAKELAVLVATRPTLPLGAVEALRALVAAEVAAAWREPILDARARALREHLEEAGWDVTVRRVRE